MRVKYPGNCVIDYGGYPVNISLHKRKDPEYLSIDMNPSMNYGTGWYIFVSPIGSSRGTYRVGEETNIVKDMAIKKINEAFLTGCLDISGCMEVIGL